MAQPAYAADVEMSTLTVTAATDDLVQLHPGTAELEQLVAQLTIANETNRVIGAAIGLLMERYRLSYGAAHQHLVRLSQESNTKMRIVAAALIGLTVAQGSPHT